ncbi:MAG: FAD:protein FMN transferase, partial [Prevotellaceae bacterium]|nr:FAD:protein FMN transferase [Prevotellaceae bacterium]
YIFGTIYNITYQSSKDLNDEILAAMNEVDASLSPFNDSSIITKINNNVDVKINSMFREVFEKAMDVSQSTDGAFDITVAPLVNAWGFGFKSGSGLTKVQIDSVMDFVGYKKVSLRDNKVVKTDPRLMLDCSAIAKGYGSDVVANLLTRKGISNFMVEIGGEIVTRGKNAEQKPWRVGVTKPTDDSLSLNTELQTVLDLTDISLATSGNYRNFYYKNGKKYAHTIDPRTGRPVQHSLLSATVLAPTCAEADAYATSFMVMGLEKTKAFLRNNHRMKAYLIYTDSKGDYKVWQNIK